MAASTSRPTVVQLVSRDRAVATSVSISSTTIDQLLFAEKPDVPYPSGSEKLYHAVEMAERYAYDDSAPHIPQNLRGATPNQLKTDGKLRLYAKEQGFIVSINPRLTHGMVLFMKGHIQVFAIVPMIFLRQGSAFRTLADKTADNVPLLEAPVIDLKPQQADNLFDQTVRTLWNLTSQPESLRKLRELLMPEEDIVGYFTTPRDNVDSITNALLPEVREVLQSGEFSLRDLTDLRHYSADWPSNQASCIYLRIYIKRNDRPGPYSDTSQADINGNVGMYFGQTRNLRNRLYAYERTMVPGSRSPHMMFALKCSPEDRHTIPIMIWEDGDVSSHILKMAEQTMILLLRSYQRYLFVPDDHMSSGQVVNSRCAKLLASFQRRAASTTGWPLINGRGLNTASPIFETYRSNCPFLSIPMAPGNPNARSFTSYRIRRTLVYSIGMAQVQLYFHSHYSDTDTRKQVFFSRVKNNTLNAQRPRYGYLVFEIMDDDKPHPRPYMGVPSVGPFKNFNQASSFGVHLEWFNKSSGRWCKVALAKGPYIDLARLARTGDVEACLKPYRDGMMIIQALRGIDYTGLLDGFPRRVTIASQDISVMKTNHLLQEYRLERQVRVSSPVPARSDWQQNYNLMVRQFSCDVTRVLVQAPTADDPVMIYTNADARSSGQLVKAGRRRNCDTCTLASARRGYISVCEPDPSHPHGCCKACSLFNRPCTFTALSQHPRLFGNRQPSRHVNYGLSVYPDGPFRWLIYRRDLSNEELDADDLVPEPFEERFGVSEEDEDVEAAERDEAQGEVPESNEE
ncbi:uncharacterized protein FSUBG_4352 [Fusarium subglutinans]|uniref:Uncharacterized protein n=1 Tax=Gibberella subglutinans TaxID=42677 RepID=A0A8H5Q7L6_GIBSU|nr:uncharacterized protein FSUBG_4352 [Fusarium subglutinans]KAF5608963.1 hypothetical protein FSUBG_4352 [Fusarium subglutinans]